MNLVINSKFFHHRLPWLYLIIFIPFLLIIKKLHHLQIQNYEYFSEQSSENRIRRITIAPPRGRVFDRNGEVLVDNRPNMELVATLEDITVPKHIVLLLSPILGKSEKELFKMITTRSSRAFRYEPSVIHSDLSLEQVIQISEIMYRLPGIDIRVKPIREYLHQQSACHILGYTGSINSRELSLLKDKGYIRTDEIGKAGIEHKFEPILRGTPGARQVQVNSRGHLDKILGEQKATKGKDITLTIDINIQKALEIAFGEKTGAAVVLDVKTGDILAMVSMPLFNPNHFSVSNNLKIREYNLNPLKPQLNRAISAEYAPGSIFKPIVALAALSTPYATKETSYFCNGSLKVYDTTFKCWRKWGHGEVDLFTSIEQSCNIYYYQISKEMGSNPIYKMSEQFRLGSRTGIGLKGERKGIIPSKHWKKKYFKKNKQQQKWHLGDTINYSIGQGYLSVTPMQMARMAAGLADGKKLIKPRLLLSIDHNREILPLEYTVQSHPLKINQKHLQLVKDGMESVIQAKNGTGRKARIKGIRLAGKTGTAQVKTATTYFKNTWFLSFGPLPDPQIAMAIVVEKGESGGLDSAPIAKAVYQKWFDIHENDLITDHEEILTTRESLTQAERKLEESIRNENNNNETINENI